jgi:glutamyl-tRNA synthetase
VEYEPAGVEKHFRDAVAATASLTTVRGVLSALPDWSAPAIEQALRGAADAAGVGFGKLVHPLRLALTGATVSPGIDAVVAHMGPELTMRRIDDAIAFLQAHSSP